jgi:hypothetical protein
LPVRHFRKLSLGYNRSDKGYIDQTTTSIWYINHPLKHSSTNRYINHNYYTSTAMVSISERAVRWGHVAIFTLVFLASVVSLAISASLVKHYNDEGYPPAHTGA